MTSFSVTLRALAPPGVLLLLLAWAACTSPVQVEPTIPHLVGTWDYEVTDFELFGNECAITDLVLVITEQDGEHFSGERSGGRTTCWTDGVGTEAGVGASAGGGTEGGHPFEGTVRSDRSVAFDFPYANHQGTVTGASMTGAVEMEFEEHPDVTGTFAAVRR